MPEGKQPIEKPEANRLTGLKKRQQIELAGRTMFLWVAVASIALSFCAATGEYLFTKWQYNNKVIGAKYQAARTLEDNITNAKQLKQDVDGLIASTELASVKTNEADPNTKSILDALPGAYDPAALATSLQQAIINRSGVTIEGITVPPETTETIPEGTDATPQEMRINIVVSGPYDRIKNLLTDLERTIRPMKIENISMTGSDSSLQATMDVVTYWQPAKSVTVKKEAVK